MVTEINNLICSQCDKPIKHAALENATVKLEMGVVLIYCEE